MQTVSPCRPSSGPSGATFPQGKASLRRTVHFCVVQPYTPSVTGLWPVTDEVEGNSVVPTYGDDFYLRPHQSALKGCQLPLQGKPLRLAGSAYGIRRAGHAAAPTVLAVRFTALHPSRFAGRYMQKTHPMEGKILPWGVFPEILLLLLSGYCLLPVTGGSPPGR